MDMSLDNAKVKSSLNMLGFSNNRIVGSNKSKAKLSIFDKIKRFYYAKKYEKALNKISKLNEEKAPLVEEVEKKDKELFTVAQEENKTEEVNAIGSEIMKTENKIKRINENLEKEKNKAYAAASKIDEIDNSIVQSSEQIFNAETSIDEVQADEQLEETQSKISEDVNAIKEDIDSSKNTNDDEIQHKEKKSENIVDAALSEIARGDKPIKAVIVTYMKKLEDRYKDLLKATVERTNKTINEIDAGYKVTINSKDNKIKLLQQNIQTIENRYNQEIKNINTDLEHTRSELARTNDMNDRYFETIEDKDKQIKDRDQQIVSLQNDVTSKDEEIANLQKEIERLRITEQKYDTIRTSLGDVLGGVLGDTIYTQGTQVEETSGKTL